MRAIAIAIAALACGCGGAPPAGTTTAEAERRECTAALRFEDPEGLDVPERSDGLAGSEAESVATDREEPPRTQVSLVLICEGEATRRVAIGSEVGACFREDAGGELLGARCWWGGEGATIRVARDGDALVVRRAGIDEHTGTGEYRESSRLEVPEGAIVQPL